MPHITLPKHPGLFRVAIARAGNYIVLNDKTGKSEIIIACRDKKEADDLCERLNKGDHKGQIWH